MKLQQRFLLLVLIFCGFGVNAQQSEAPKLVVGIVVDQMCYEYLYRYEERYGKKGLRLLMEKGTNCRNTNFNYVPTYTGPGHASIYTGTTPSNHGIIANDWYDRELGRQINCVEDTTQTTVGSDNESGLCSPKNLKSNTITDQLKLTYPDAKVVSMSIKNRGAILPGGHLSDGSYWYDFSNGNFVTSSFFKESLPSWVSDFNAKKSADEYMKGTWNTLYPIESYTASGPDDSPYEHLLPGKTTPTFPYDLSTMVESNELVTAPGLFPYTPYANTFLTDFALAGMRSEGLGQDDQTDMLCISYSTPDIIGHAFGPYSIEIEDTYLRLDQEIERLIATLNKEIGKGEYVIFLTADHAVVPVPQMLLDHNLPGGYFFQDTNFVMLGDEMIEQFGQDFVDDYDNLNIYLDRDSIEIAGYDYNDVLNFTLERVRAWDGVKRVFTGHQLYNSNAEDPWLNMVRNGYHHKESGDIIFTLEPGYLPKSADSDRSRKGTSHGSAYSYDTHVPLLWYGADIPKKEVMRSVNITDITATLTHLLYLQQVNAMTGNPIVELFED
jgi:predicted AlkP superfamily pyrophosphatase or phosphodiesterase